MFYGSIIFRFIGVLIRWVFEGIIFKLVRKGKIKSFKEVWNGPYSDDLANNASYEISNIIIGIIVFLVIAFLSV